MTVQTWLLILPFLCGSAYGFLSIFNFLSDRGKNFQIIIKEFFWLYPFCVNFAVMYFVVKANPAIRDTFFIGVSGFCVYGIGIVFGKWLCGDSKKPDVYYEGLSAYQIAAPHEYSGLCAYVEARDYHSAVNFAWGIAADRHIKPDDISPVVLKMFAYRGLLRVAECYHKDKYVYNVFLAANKLENPEIVRAFKCVAKYLS